MAVHDLSSNKDAPNSGGTLNTDSSSAPYGGYANCSAFATHRASDSSGPLKYSDAYSLCKGYEAAEGWSPS